MIMKRKFELYLATLWNNNRIVVSIKPEDYNNMAIGEKKRKIVAELNEKFQTANFVKYVKFYGYADVEIKDQFLKHK